jgi:hypothetical protein
MLPAIVGAGMHVFVAIAVQSNLTNTSFDAVPWPKRIAATIWRWVCSSPWSSLWRAIPGFVGAGLLVFMAIAVRWNGRDTIAQWYAMEAGNAQDIEAGLAAAERSVQLGATDDRKLRLAVFCARTGNMSRALVILKELAPRASCN